MKITADILKSIRSKLTVKSIIILSVISILIFPAILIENASIPTSDSHLYFLSNGYDIHTVSVNHNSKNASNIGAMYQSTYSLINNKLEPVSNTSVRLNVSVVDSNLLDHFFLQLNIYFNVITKKNGSFTLNNTDLLFLLPVDYNRTQNSIRSYHIENYTVLEGENRLVTNQKDDKFGFNSFDVVVNNRTGERGVINMAFLPFYNLGYYGIAPIFLMSGNSSGSYNLSYHLYNPQDQNSVGPLVYLGNYSFNKIYTINSNEGRILSMNEAFNVTFFVNGIALGTVYHNTVLPISITSGISILGLLGNTGAEIMLLVTVFMVLTLFVPMFNLPVYMYYLSLPRKRWYTITNEFISSILTMSIFEGFAFTATYLISELMLHYSLSILAFIYIYLFSVAAFTVFSSLYLLIGVFFIGKTMPRISLTIFLILGYPLIDSLSQSILEIQAIFSDNVLFKPLLDNIRTYNLISGILPVLNVEELNSYFLRSPASGVIMLNHLSIFDLSPLIFLSSIIGISLTLFYLSIKRYYKY